MQSVWYDVPRADVDPKQGTRSIWYDVPREDVDPKREMQSVLDDRQEEDVDSMPRMIIEWTYTIKRCRIRLVNLKILFKYIQRFPE